jgi:uncharacterized membrane protein YozB (DUF420 family)
MASVAKSTRRPPWLVPTGLILLSVIPVTAGVVLVVQLFGHPSVTPANARFVALPAPVIAHIVTASLYCVLGPLQFIPSFRRGSPRWHRVAGRVLVLCGLVAGLAGLWMTLFYPDAPGDGALLTGLRLVFGSAMVASIALGLAAILRRDVAAHRAWMIRGYAIGQGAGTQAFLGVLWLAVGDGPFGTARALMLGAGWMINVAIAEWLIRRQPHRERRSNRLSRIAAQLS